MIIEEPGVHVIDLIVDYIKPVIISFVACLVYLTITYRKLGILESLVEPAIKIVIIGALYVSILSICRIPLNEFVVPIGIIIYIMSLLGVTVCLNKKKGEA